MVSEDVFSKALENPAAEFELSLPEDDVETGVISSDSDAEDGSSSSEGAGDESSSSEADEGAEREFEEDDEDAGTTVAIRSKNEISEEPIPQVPDDYQIPENANISEIGTIKSAFDFNLIIHATLSGERRIPREGSILCLQNRSLIGPLCEVFGKLQSPFYRVSITSSKVEEFNELKKHVGEKAFIVLPDAHWVDTFELKKQKGTDASNGYDEELSDDEQEFSDDEKEALFKRMKKDQKKKRDGVTKPMRQKQKPQVPAHAHAHAQISQAKSGHSYKSRSSRQQNDENFSNASSYSSSVTNAQALPQAVPPPMIQPKVQHMLQPGLQSVGRPPIQSIGQPMMQPMMHSMIKPATQDLGCSTYSPTTEQYQIQQVIPMQYHQRQLQNSYNSYANQPTQLYPMYPNTQYYAQQEAVRYNSYMPQIQPPQQQEYNQQLQQQEGNMQQVLQLHQILMQQQQQQQQQQQHSNQRQNFSYDE